MLLLQKQEAFLVKQVELIQNSFTLLIVCHVAELILLFQNQRRDLKTSLSPTN